MIAAWTLSTSYYWNWKALSPCFQVGPHKHTQMDGSITVTNIRAYQAFEFQLDQ